MSSESALEGLARALMGSGRAITWKDNDDGTGILYVPDDMPDPIEVRRIPRPIPYSDSGQQPSSECECGGYIGWTEHPDYWDGSCYGICSGYPVIHKTT